MTKNLKSTDRCRAKVYLPCHTEPARCVGWRHHFGDHLTLAKGSTTGCNKESPIPLQITWPSGKSAADIMKDLRPRK